LPPPPLPTWFRTCSFRALLRHRQAEDQVDVMRPIIGLSEVISGVREAKLTRQGGWSMAKDATPGGMEKWSPAAIEALSQSKSLDQSQDSVLLIQPLTCCQRRHSTNHWDRT
jgi:hypothetical protein